MSRGKQGKKRGRAEAHRAHQARLAEAKRLRKQRRHEHGVLNLREQTDLTRVVAKNIDQGWAGPTDSLPIDHPETREAVKNLIEIESDHPEVTPFYPSDAMWADMVAQAKKRKRGIVKVAEKAGWRLVDGDGKSQTDWSTI